MSIYKKYIYEAYIDIYINNFLNLLKNYFKFNLKQGFSYTNGRYSFLF